MQTALFFAALSGIVVAVSALNEQCRRVEDCADAGATCLGGICRCWTDQGPQIAEIWSCNSDNTCAMSFPGHVCRISRECSRTQGRLGYCQPIGAIRAPATAAPVVVKAETETTQTLAPPTTSAVSGATTSGSGGSVTTTASVTTGGPAVTTTYRSVGGGYMGRR
ncbi:hypothetical protein BV898_07783 [Hypsibius exemplaris]|uniref:EB domain-containing protein n=1 Tax=Hypsibius exemplaris TaxID=2072580 RepID=A0A1W0WSR6_HYPEX|nr:hypothetical protein BV898_07783 [Hypsibius exemplaris]